MSFFSLLEFTLFLFLQSLTFLNAQQQNQDIISIRTNYLKINFVPGDGTFTLYTLKDGSETEYQTDAPGLKLNNIYQKNFKVISGQPLVLQNQSLRLSVQVIDENSIAVEWTTKDDSLRELELHIKSEDETEYYGMGERFNSLNQRGYILPNVTDDRYGNKGVGTHKPVPFFMSNRGLGVWVDSYSPGIFDLNGSERFETRIKFKENKFKLIKIRIKNFVKFRKSFIK